MDSKYLIESIDRLHQRFVAEGTITSLFQPPATPTPAGSVGQAAARTAYLQLVEALKNLVRPVIEADGLDLKIAKNLGLGKYAELGTFAQLQSEATSPPAQGAAAQIQRRRTQLQRDFTGFANRISQARAALHPFSIEAPEVGSADGIVEIIFKGDASLNDFGVAHKRMADWYRILQGYARALECAPEDFQIVSMEMHSPAKWKIRTKLEYAKLFLEVVTALVAIELGILQSKVLLEQLKSMPMTSPEVHETFVKDAESRSTLKAQEDIDTVVTNALNRMGRNTPEVKSFFLRGVQTQYQFNVSGGEVNVYLPENTEGDQGVKLAQAKQEVQQLQAKIKELQLASGPQHPLLQPPDTSAGAEAGETGEQ